ncbi:MAG: ribosome silencing factor [Bacteroidota bacterium]|jgi:ribosome-associated protein
MAQKKKNKVDSALLSEIVVKGMQEKKAEDITVIDLRSVPNAITDFFVICSVNSDSQADAVENSVEAEVYKTLAMDPIFKEGKENKEWILVDYFDVVVHVFRKSRREFFKLEKLWGDGVITDIPNLI